MNIGMILLGVYLILIGLMAIVPSVTIPPIVPGILALVAGILILVGR